MTIEEIIKEAFSRGWNASHECATDFDYEYALNGFLSEVETEVKKFRIGAVISSVCKCKGGAVGRTVTADFEHQICDRCGNIAN